MDKSGGIPQRYVIVDSAKYGPHPKELTEKCITDLNKEHRSLQINRNYLKSISGEGTLYNVDNHMSYLYVASSAYSAGTGRYLAYSVQYAGAKGFKGVLFDIVSNDGCIVYTIFEAPKFGKNNTLRLHIPFDTDIDPRETKLRIKQLFKTGSY